MIAIFDKIQQAKKAQQYEENRKSNQIIYEMLDMNDKILELQKELGEIRL